jgi:hypothetical protein
MSRRGESVGTRVRMHVRSNVVGYIALFVALGGTAAALPGTNTVDSGDIVNQQVKSADLANGQVRSTDVADDSTLFALTGGDIANGSLSGGDIADGSLGGSDVADGSLGGSDIADGSVTGADVNESSLGQVPSALLGGYGRSFSGNGCDPNSSTYIDCGFTTLNLPSTTRVLLIAAARGYSPSGDGFGYCRLVTSNGVLGGTDVGVDHTEEVAALTTVTGVLGPGSVDFGIECQETFSNIKFFEVRVSAVALSSN